MPAESSGASTSRAGRLRRPRRSLSLLGLVTLLGVVALSGSADATARGVGAASVPGGPAGAANGTAAGSGLAVVQPVRACEQLAGLDLAGLTGTPVSIGSAAATTATPGGWAACRVTGNLAPQLQFEVLLPTATWRQLYLQTGCGGFCGSVRIDAPAASGCVPLTDGQFVMASGNQGHFGTAPFDATFGADPELRKDFGYRSEHKLAVFTKQLIDVFYGKPARYSFYDGCSQGGHQGLTEAQRYPKDFDGIVSGAPASITQPLNVWYQAWNALANRSPDGRSILTPDKLAILHGAAVEACGDRNGLIMNPMTCRFDPAAVQCAAGAGDSSSCLTAEQVGAARKLYQGPRDERGRLMYPGWQVPGSELEWVPWVVPATPGGFTIDPTIALNAIRYLAYPGIDPRRTLEDVPFTAAGFRQIMRATSDTFDATDPDLRAFRDAGGKLILWHGLADAAISPIGTIAYHQAVQDRMGGPAATARFARLFLMPGMGHCAGGEGPSSFDALSAVVDWVVNGKAPDSLLTTRPPGSTNPVRSLPAYPYPLQATYNGTGDVNDAGSYHAAPPPVPFDGHVRWLGAFTPRNPRR
jgi:hypothetical protein